ncbi:RIP metalloprotease RseP [Marinilabiliaceae bacterium ANBcel2]|nr:RIP metalloprotease RseP [Marinilabiliaceae bacterium ANBcel2]
MEFLIKALQLILSLSILVILHEFGHFFFARLFKTRVEKFYLFFNPGFSLFKYKKGETEYGIGWLPLGGYVKISGMIDESMDKEQMNQPPKPYEFRSKPAWQRLMIMVGGVLMNFITAMVIFWMILFTWGESYIPAENAQYGFHYHPVAHEIGLQDGDHIVAVDDKEIKQINEVAGKILLDDATRLKVKRGDSLLTINIPENFGQRMLAEVGAGFVSYQLPVLVDSVASGFAAEKAGLQKGDSIFAVNGVETPFYHQFTGKISEHKGEVVNLSLTRDGYVHDLEVEVSSEGVIGFVVKSPMALFDTEDISYGFFAAFPAGIDKGVDILSGYVRQLGLVFTPEGAKQIGGFGTIGGLFPSLWDWQTFWFTTAFLSLILAFMNILPIPALDGGHVMFLIYEIVVGKKPSDRFMEYATVTGMMLLFALLIYANGNDIYRWLF